MDRLAELEAEVASLRRQVALLAGPTTAADGLIAKNSLKKQVFGYGYVARRRDGSPVVDWSGDTVNDDDLEALEDAAYEFVRKSRFIDADHDGARVGELIESFVVTPAKLAKLGVPEGILPIGHIIGVQVEHGPTWGRVEKGELLSFSLTGKGARRPL